MFVPLYLNIKTDTNIIEKNIKIKKIPRFVPWVTDFNTYLRNEP
jgi:hypothetical protein